MKKVAHEAKDERGERPANAMTSVLESEEEESEEEEEKERGRGGVVISCSAGGPGGGWPPPLGAVLPMFPCGLWCGGGGWVRRRQKRRRSWEVIWVGDAVRAFCGWAPLGGMRPGFLA